LETPQATTSNAEPLLDDLDERIIATLTSDGRAPFSKIAKLVGVSPNTVRNRLKALLEHGVIEISAYPNPNRGSSRLRVQLTIQVGSAHYFDVSKKLSDSVAVHYLALTSGQFDMIALASFESRQEMLEFITDVITKTPGIISMSSSIVLEVAKTRGRVLRKLPSSLEATADGKDNR